MAREFVMGARLVLRDMFSGGLIEAARQTMRFRGNLDEANRALGHYRDAQGRLRNEQGRYVSSARQAADGTRAVGTAAERAKKSLLSMKNAIGAVVAGASIKAAWDWTVGANSNMEQYENTLTVIMGSQEKAVKTLEWANKFAAQTPFEIPQIVEATTRMSAYGLNAEKTLGVVGDMASVMGKDLMQAVEAVADAQTGELERLKEFGITKGMIEDQAKMLGATPINTKGQITDMEAFNAALLSLMEKRFKGGMEIQSKSFKGMVSNVQDSIGTIGRKLGEPLFDKAKANLQVFLGWLNKMQADGSIDRMIGQIVNFGSMVGRIFSSAFTIAKNNVAMVADRLQKFYTDNEPNIIKIGALFVAAWEGLQAGWTTAQPTIDYITANALPAIVDLLTTIGSIVLEVAGYIIDNWSWIGPLVTGVAISWGTYVAVQKLMVLWSKRQVAITAIVTAYQWALNLALNANPMGLVVLAIGLLIGAGILLYKNWDKIVAWLGAAWNSIKTWSINAFKSVLDFIIKWGPLFLAAITGPIGLLVYAIATNWDAIKAGTIAVWNGITTWLSGAWDKIKQTANNVWTGIKDGLAKAWDGMKGLFVDGLNWVIVKLNNTVDKVNAAMNVDMPAWMGGGKVGFTIPTIPTIDGSHFSGLPQVPFDGYIAQLHKDEAVLPASEANAYRKTGINPAGTPTRGGRGGKTVNVDRMVGELHVHAAEGMDEDRLSDLVVEKLYDQLAQADEIAAEGDMGGLL